MARYEIAEQSYTGDRYEAVGGFQRVAPPTWQESLALTAAEVAPAIGLGMLGALSANPAVVWGSGAAGGAVGNLWAQNLRQDMGLSDGVSIGELGAATIAGAIPFAKVAASGVMAKSALHAAQGSMIAGGELFARKAFEGVERGEGWQLPSREEVATTLAFGGMIGGTLGAVEAKFFSKALDVNAKPGMKDAEVQALVEKKAEEASLSDLIETQPGWVREAKAQNLFDDPKAAAHNAYTEAKNALVDATDNLTIDQLRIGLANQEQANMTSWMNPKNQPKQSVLESIGIKPAQLALPGDVTPPAPGKYMGAKLDEFAVADLKAAMTAMNPAQTPAIQKFEYAKNTVLALGEKERKGGKLVKGQRTQRKQALANMEQALDEMPKGAELPAGYTDQYRRILELENQLDVIDSKQRIEVTPEQRKQYAEQARRVREEIYGVENKLTKEEQHAKDFLPMDKFSQWVASGALSSAPLSMYFNDDEEDDGVATASLAFLASATMMALLLGKGAPAAMRGFKNLRKDYAKRPTPKLNAKGRINRKDMPVDFHEAVVNEATKEGSFKYSPWKDIKESGVSLFSHILEPLSRVAKKIDIRVARAFQEMEQDINTSRRNNNRNALFMYAMDSAAKQGGWYREWARAYSYEGAKGHQAIQQLFANNEKAVTKAAREILKREGDKNYATATVGFGQGSGDYTHARYRENMDKMFVELKDDAGYQFGYRKGFNPRMVKSYTQLRNYLESTGAVYTGVLDKALAEYAERVGKPVKMLTKHEQVQVASRLFSGEIIEGIPGKLKERKFSEIPEELMDAYEDPGKALASYINQMSEKKIIRQRFAKFLPKNMGKDAAALDFGYAKLDDTLAGQLAKGFGEEQMIRDPEQLKALQYIIQKRINPDPTNKLVSLWRNSNYFSTISGFGTAITNLMDLVNTFYFGGEKGKNAFNAIFTKEKNDWFRELGIDRGNGVDFGASASGMNKMLDQVLSATGFNQLDKWSKNVSLQALYLKFRNLAKKDGQKLFEELQVEFGEKQARAMVEDLKTWNGKIDGEMPTPASIQHLLFAKASDFLPISRMEMPGAAEGSFAPLFYQLKNYTIKQFDIYREINRGRLGQARSLLNQGKNAEAAKLAFDATKALAGYGTILAMAGASTDTVKDIIYGRPVNVEDKVYDNVLRLALVNRYHKYKMEREGPGKALLEMIMPASSFVDRTSKDIMGFIDGENYKGHALQGTILDGIYWGVEGMGGYEKLRQ